MPFCVYGAPVNLVQNGSFETNGGANSNLLPGWTIVDEQGGSGTWLAQTGTTGPVTPEFDCGTSDVPPPPDGAFSAMATQANEGSHILYQDITIPEGATAVLSFQWFVNSASRFFAPDSLSYHTNPNQQFRVDIVDPAADLFTTSVLQNVLQIGPGNRHTLGYERATATLSGFGGRTVRLRFVEVDNQACLLAGIDDVRVEIDAPNPAPSIARFTVSAEEIPFAGAVTLNWQTQHATSVSIDHGIGDVAASGSRTISLQENTTFTLTATGTAGTATRVADVGVASPGPSITSFSANPSFIEPGQTATLTWSTDAPDVSIDNGIGAVAASGSITVTPAKTTEYTLTAKDANGTSTSRATVFVDPGDVPIVSVTSYPEGIVQLAGSPAGGTDHLVLTNLGRVATTITLTQSGDFFTQSPATFALAAGATQVVTITATTQAPGKYQGQSIVSGAGVPDGLTIPVQLFIATAPLGTIAPTTAVARQEIAAPAGQNPSGSVTFTNQGTGTLQGIATSDAAWLIPQTDLVIIGPGETKAVTFTTNRALRDDAASPGGAATATLSVVYVDSGSSALRAPVVKGGGTTRTVSVTIVDVVKPGAVPGAPPPLAPGEIAFFVPGLFQRSSTSGDLQLSVIGNSIADLKLYLAAPGVPSLVGSLDQLAPNAGVSLPSVLQNVFATSASTATVQARSASLSRVALAGLRTNQSGPNGSFITALPTFRSDRAFGPGDVIYLPGIEKSASRTTDLFVQEVSGVPATAKIDFLDASGTVVSSRASESVDGFGLLSLADVAPPSAASIRATNVSTNGARIVAYALVIDASTQDAWTVIDSIATDQTVAIPPAVASGTTTNAMFILNPNDSPLDVTVDLRFSGGRRRAIGSRSGANSTTVTLGAGETRVVPVRFSNGYVRLTASRPFVVSGRSTTNATFGSALPVLETSESLRSGQSRRFGGVDDASRSTIIASSPLTYRSTLGLVESAGQPATVKLTLRYSFSAGTRSTAQGLSAIAVQVPANRLVLFNELARSIIGNARDNYGDLRNMQLDVEVVSGDGRIAPFLETIDNGSADAAIRVE